MRLLATTLLLALLAAPASAQSKFNELWSAQPAYLDAATRGLAFTPDLADGSGSSNDRLVLYDRTNDVLRVHDPNTGSLLSSPALPASISGGTFKANDLDATSDGVLIICNLSQNAAFKCYSIADETALSATEIVNFTPAGDSRLGDKINVVGSSSDYSIWVADASQARVFRFSSDALSVPTEIPLTFSNGSAISGNGTSPSVAPRQEDGSTGFFVTGNGTALREYNAAGVFQGELSGGTLASGTNGLTYFEKNGHDWLSVYDYNNFSSPPYHRAAIVDVTGGATTATIYDRTPSVGTVSSSGNGDTAVRDNPDGTVTVFVLGASNGVGAFTTTEPKLPVELTAFTGAADGSRAVLRWSTASETNNAGFDVQHAAHGADFRSVHFAPGAGTTLEAQHYAFTSAELAPGTHTFRLRQLDLDGAENLSHLVEVTVSAGGAALAVAPNPSRERAAVTLSVPSAQHVEVSAYDALGRRVATLFSGAAEGRVPMTLSGAAPGVYVLVAEGETFRTTTTATVLR
jgi:hypothetical protein